MPTVRSKHVKFVMNFFCFHLEWLSKIRYQNWCKQCEKYQLHDFISRWRILRKEKGKVTLWPYENISNDVFKEIAIRTIKWHFECVLYDFKHGWNKHCSGKFIIRMRIEDAFKKTWNHFTITIYFQNYLDGIDITATN